MRVAIVHGYFLGDSGSGVYVRQIAQALVRDGHEVTLVCQEREPERYGFIDSAWALDATNTRLALLGQERPQSGPGSCRLVRPDDGGRLLVYVDGPFPGFERAGISTFQDAPAEWIDAFVDANIAALRTTFLRWPPDVVLAQHTIAQPHIVRTALDGRCPYTVTVHGSELNFSLRVDPRLAPIGVSGLEDASAVVALTNASLAECVGWAAEHSLSIAEKSFVLPPGVDADLFAPAPSRAAAIEALAREVALPDGFDLSPDDEVLAFAGRVGWNKGIQHAVVALSMLSASRPNVKLLVAGAGPARGALERLAELFSAGDVDGARALAASDEELRTTDEYGPLIPPDAAAFGPARVAYLEHLPAAGVARMFAAADIAVAPSIFPEAAALVTTEALAAGALPLVAYHSGLAALGDLERDAFADDTFTALAPGVNLSSALAAAVSHELGARATRAPAFRAGLHRVAKQHFPDWHEVAMRYLEIAGRAASP